MEVGEIRLSCCAVISFWILVLLNAMFLVAGASMIGLGGYVVYDEQNIGRLFNVVTGGQSGMSLDHLLDVQAIAAVQRISILMVIAGGLIFVICVFGFYGAIGRRRPLTVVYVAMVALLVMVQMTATYLIMKYNKEVVQYSKDLLSDNIQNAFSNQSHGSGFTIVVLFNYLQVQWQCCGINSYQDYGNLLRWSQTIRFEDGSEMIALYPFTCCKVTSQLSLYDIMNIGNNNWTVNVAQLPQKSLLCPSFSPVQMAKGDFTTNISYTAYGRVTTHSSVVLIVNTSTAVTAWKYTPTTTTRALTTTNAAGTTTTKASAARTPNLATNPRTTINAAIPTSRSITNISTSIITTTGVHVLTRLIRQAVEMDLNQGSNRNTGCAEVWKRMEKKVVMVTLGVNLSVMVVEIACLVAAVIVLVETRPEGSVDPLPHGLISDQPAQYPNYYDTTRKIPSAGRASHIEQPETYRMSIRPNHSTF